jgi:hypothetical protein
VRHCPEYKNGLKVVLQPSRTLWAAGDSDSPVSRTVLQAAIDKHGTASSRQEGVAQLGPIRLGYKLMDLNKGTALIADPEKPRKTLPPVPKYFTCNDRHFGLCKRDAGDRLPAILVVCCNLNTLCSSFSRWFRLNCKGWYWARFM